MQPIAERKPEFLTGRVGTVVEKAVQ